MKQRLASIQKRIAGAARDCGRDPAAVRLVAVSKTHPPAAIEEAVRAGADILGENYIQEAREKIAGLGHLPVFWHFIGHLQRNKAKYAVRLFDLIHSVDSLKLARELDKEAKKRDKIQAVLVQVNISGEARKSGAEAEALQGLLSEMAELDHLEVRGLMTLPPFFDQPEKARPYFRRLRELRDELQGDLADIDLRELSMGMTGDFEVAIAEGATLVRIGTAIFGSRE